MQASERMYRDPVHNIISLWESDPAERLVTDLIDSPEFQRLRRIKQLGLALYTYQGAEHSRFAHSLGVMHVMRRVLERLSRHHVIPEDVRCVALAAALLHDIGHGPFSHVIEKVFGEPHEHRTIDILNDSASHIHQLLVAHDPRLPERIVSVYHYEYKPAFVCQLVSSQLDVDRFDYLLRDSLMTGARYGRFDLEWILRTLRLDAEMQRVHVARKGLYAVEQYLQARYYMFRQVYFHRTLRSAEVILLAIVRRAIQLFAQGALRFQLPDAVFSRILRSEALSPAEYLDLDDSDLLYHIKQWRREEDPVISDLSRRFLDRDLLKAIDLDFAADREEEFVGAVRKLADRAGFDSTHLVIRDSASDIPYYGYYSPNLSDTKANIHIESGYPDPSIREISEISHVVRGMRGYRIHRLYFPVEIASGVRDLAREVQK